jgi:CheY-like chemotaxis protein
LLTSTISKMNWRLRAPPAQEDEAPSAGSGASGVRPSVPNPSRLLTPIESDLPPPFTPGRVDREAGRYFRSSAPPSDKLHVLVVEDDEVVRGTIQEIVAEQGHTAVSAANLTEARVYLAVAMPDVMVLDLNLEGEFGGDLLPELATLHGAPTTVLVSAYPFAGLVAERYGVELVRKPFSIGDLERAIDRAWIEGRRPRGPKVIIGRTK